MLWADHVALTIGTSNLVALARPPSVVALSCCVVHILIKTHLQSLIAGYARMESRLWAPRRDLDM